MTNWFKVAVDAATAQPEDGAVYLLGVADAHAAAELDTHVDYYERAAGDISQALEYVEDTGTEAAVALRATQRTMSSVATALRRRAAELRGEAPFGQGVVVLPPDPHREQS